MISPGPLEPVADFGPTDRLAGWAMTAVIAALAAITRLINVSQPTDGGTPIFDEKHYAPQAWQMLQNGGVEDNPGYGLVVHPPVGKMLIAIGEAMFGYNGLGWRFTGAVAGVVVVVLVARIARRTQPLHDGRRDRGPVDHRRRGQLRVSPDSAAGRVPHAVRRRRVRRADRRPRPDASADGRRVPRRPHRRNTVGSAAGRAMVAVRRRGAVGAGLRHQVVRALLHGVLRGDVTGVRRRRAAAVPGAAAVAGRAASRHRADRRM